MQKKRTGDTSGVSCDQLPAGHPAAPRPPEFSISFFRFLLRRANFQDSSARREDGCQAERVQGDTNFARKIKRKMRINKHERQRKPAPRESPVGADLAQGSSVKYPADIRWQPPRRL